MRKVHDRPLRRALPAAQRSHHTGIGTRRRTRPGDDEHARAAPDAFERCLDGLSERRRGAESLDPDRRAGRRGLSGGRRFRLRSNRPGARDAGEGAHLRPRAGHASLPASALGRHAAARGHRHGAGPQSPAADPGRAHHRPGRDSRGGGPRPDSRSAPRVRDDAAFHQPQPRRGHPHVRARGCALCRPAGGGGRHRGCLR